MARHVGRFAGLPTTAIGLTIKFEEVPLTKAQRFKFGKISDGIWHVVAHLGFAEVANLPLVLS
jgi:K+ transporter